MKRINNTKSELYFDEMFLNRLGYEWINAGYISQSIEIFKLTVSKFPESWNVFDILGEAYMKNGDNKNATINYRKSIELNPDNENAKRMLGELQK